MVKKELIKKSPLRILEKSTHGGVGKGNIGIIAGRHGVGKTACLVHIATDQLFQGKHVIHVSFASNTTHIISWYEDIFKEIAQRRSLEQAMVVHDEIIKHRVIMNFNQEGVTIEQVVKSLKSMIKQGAFNADCIIIDGYNFIKGSPDDLDAFKKFAAELDLELWFSASLKQEELISNEDGIPRLLTRYLEHVAIFIILKPEKGAIHLELLKDHNTTPITDMHLKLDPKILLITQEM